jgi:hypothetical protein
MKRVSNQSGRLIVELMLVLPFLLALVLVSSEIARFTRCKQAAVVLTSEIGEAAYRACGELVEVAVVGVNNLSASEATRQRIQICLNELMQPFPEANPQIGFNQFTTDLGNALGVQNFRARVGIYDGSSGTPVLIEAFPSTGGPTSRFENGTSSVNPASTFLTKRGRFAVAEVYFSVSGMMSFSRAFGLSGIQPNGEVYEAALF